MKKVAFILVVLGMASVVMAFPDVRLDLPYTYDPDGIPDSGDEFGPIADYIVGDASYPMNAGGIVDEEWERAREPEGTSLTVPAGTSITLGTRSKCYGGSIIIDGGTYTVNGRQDTGDGEDATIIVNSGQFIVNGGGTDSLRLPDNSGGVQTILIGDGLVQAVSMAMGDGRASSEAGTGGSLLTFTPGGVGELRVDTAFLATRPPGDSFLPEFWLQYAADFPGFGLFAAEGEVISITEDGPWTVITSVPEPATMLLLGLGGLSLLRRKRS